LRRAVYNNFINNYRLQKKRNLLLEAYYRDVVEMHFETDTNIIADMVSSLHQCIEKLPNKCKEVLVLSKIKGIKLKDLSVKLKVSRKTLEGHTTRAYVFLKDCLKKSHPSLV
jgi:RNA polymerase sigma-70 factor (ECF subfamily)